MTIVEALKQSKETGQLFERAATDGFLGWLKFHEPWVYKLEAVDLMADDWEPITDPKGESNGEDDGG